MAAWNLLIPMYSSDAKTCAQQIVRESFESILCSTYHVPTLEEMELILQNNFKHNFDEYKSIQKIRRSHPEWDDEMIAMALTSEREKYENELQVNLRVAVLETIEEIENLTSNLNNTLREWKIRNL
jgi:hypothetical protein